MSSHLDIQNSCDCLSYEELLRLPVLITADEAARVCGISGRQMRRIAETGAVASCKPGPNTFRIRTDSLLAYLGLSETVEAMARARAAEDQTRRLSEALGALGTSLAMIAVGE